MSFDALTITGILATVLSGGFLFGLVSRNDPNRRCCDHRDDPSVRPNRIRGLIPGRLGPPGRSLCRFRQQADWAATAPLVSSRFFIDRSGNWAMFTIAAPGD